MEDKQESENVDGKIFVGGLSWQTSEEGLRYYFEKFGELTDVAIMSDKRTGQPRGFGFVCLKDPAAVDIVLGQTHNIDGRVVDVKRAVPRDKAPAPSRQESRKLFVGGLAPEVGEKEFSDYFSKYGPLQDTIVMYDRKTNRSRGFGFVTFENEEDIQAVLRTEHEIMGKWVEIKRAEPREPSKPMMPMGMPMQMSGRMMDVRGQDMRGGGMGRGRYEDPYGYGAGAGGMGAYSMHPMQQQMHGRGQVPGPAGSYGYPRYGDGSSDYATGGGAVGRGVNAYATGGGYGYGPGGMTAYFGGAGGYPAYGGGAQAGAIYATGAPNSGVSGAVEDGAENAYNANSSSSNRGNVEHYANSGSSGTVNAGGGGPGSGYATSANSRSATGSMPMYQYANAGMQNYGGTYAMNNPNAAAMYAQNAIPIQSGANVGGNPNKNDTNTGYNDNSAAGSGSYAGYRSNQGSQGRMDRNYRPY